MNRYQYAQTGRALPMCGDCGAIVGDTALHDKHHEDTDSMTLLNVTTATNLLATVTALLDLGIGVEVNVSEVPE
jgi:hypothetical protein